MPTFAVRSHPLRGLAAGLLLAPLGGLLLASLLRGAFLFGHWYDLL